MFTSSTMVDTANNLSVAAAVGTTPVATTTSVTTTGPFNATRNPQPPLQQPSYNFQHVPNATKDLQYSTLQKINDTNRNIFQQSMAELLLLCKEAVRRRRHRRPAVDAATDDDDDTNERDRPNARRRSSPRRTTAITRNSCGTQLPSPSSLLEQQQQLHGHPQVVGSGNKPLSLEYIADRLDIDDPCFGYIVRTHEHPGSESTNATTTAAAFDASFNGSNNNKWQPGMLQGFITATTFTNWQKSFCWDSINEAAYYDDDDDDDDDDDGDEHHKANRPLPRPRIRDVDGSLAQELQSTVHCGNIHGEGIVWPRIAEISLLGGLGCGATLVRTLIDELESSTTKPTIMANYDYLVLQATDNSIPFYESMGFVRVGAIMLEEDQHRNSDELANSPSDAIPTHETTEKADDTNISSPVFTYEVNSTGETLSRIASKFHVDVYDILFLNRHLLGMQARPCDKPRIHANLSIPKNSQNSRSSKNDDKTNSDDNNELPTYVPALEIQWHTCKENDTPRTIAKMYNVSTFDIVERNKGRLPGLISSSRLKENTRIKVSHLDFPDNLYKPYAHWSFPDSKYEDPEPSYMMVRKLHRRRKLGTNHSSARKHPSGATAFTKRNDAVDNRTSTSFLLSIKGVIVENDIPNPSLLFSPPTVKMPPPTTEVRHQRSSVLETTTVPSTTPYAQYSDNDPLIKSSLYNKVVRLKPGAMTEGSNYTYWYVLTYIPDLQWCHLAPMIQDGIFGTDKPKAFGKAKWRLLDEMYGQEVDISSKFCIPVKSRSMKKTLDADKEEWDVNDDGTDPTVTAGSTYRRNSINRSGSNNQRGTIAIKPSTDRVRKMPLSSSVSSSASFILESPNLLAAIPGTGRITMVRLVGRLLFKQPPVTTTSIGTRPETINSSKRKRGRPFGSKNKQTSPSYDIEVCSPMCPMGKKRRLNSPIVHVQASARKAAAMRTTSKIGRLIPVQNSSPFKRSGTTIRESLPINSNLMNEKEKKKNTVNTVKRKLNAVSNTKRTLPPPRRASLSSSTYTLESPSLDGSTYHRNNTHSDSETLTVESFHEEDDDDTSEFGEKPLRKKRRITSTKPSGRRSSRLANPPTHVKTDTGSSSESATLKRRTTRFTSTYQEAATPGDNVAFESDGIEEVVTSTTKSTKRSTTCTPPALLPKLPLVMNGKRKEQTLTIRSVDFSPSVFTEKEQRLARRTINTSEISSSDNDGRPKLRQQNLNSMIVPKKGRIEAVRQSTTATVATTAAAGLLVSHSRRSTPRINTIPTSSNANAVMDEYVSCSTVAQEDDSVHNDDSSNHRPRRKSASYT